MQARAWYRIAKWTALDTQYKIGFLNPFVLQLLF